MKNKVVMFAALMMLSQASIAAQFAQPHISFKVVSTADKPVTVKKPSDKPVVSKVAIVMPAKAPAGKQRSTIVFAAKPKSKVTFLAKAPTQPAAGGSAAYSSLGDGYLLGYSAAAAVAAVILISRSGGDSGSSDDSGRPGTGTTTRGL